MGVWKLSTDFLGVIITKDAFANDGIQTSRTLIYYTFTKHLLLFS